MRLHWSRYLQLRVDTLSQWWCKPCWLSAILLGLLFLSSTDSPWRMRMLFLNISFYRFLDGPQPHLIPFHVDYKVVLPFPFFCICICRLSSGYVSSSNFTWFGLFCREAFITQFEFNVLLGNLLFVVHLQAKSCSLLSVPLLAYSGCPQTTTVRRYRRFLLLEKVIRPFLNLQFKSWEITKWHQQPMFYSSNMYIIGDEQQLCCCYQHYVFHKVYLLGLRALE